MTITLGSNIASLKAQRELAKGTDALSRNFERLASGQRINRAQDDAAGLAVSSSLQLQSRVFSQGVRNINDGLSFLSIADGALVSLSDVNLRLGELSEQAANGTYSLKQKKALQKEADALVDEFNRIVASTKFNDIKIFDPQSYSGNLSIQAGIGSAATLALEIGSQLNRTVGTGQFGTPSTISTNGVSLEAQILDLNGDGKSDLLYSELVGFAVRFGNGDGSFGVAKTYSALASHTLKAVDVNGDGLLDVVSATGGTNVGIALNQGSGTFGTTISFFSAAGFLITEFSLGDLNNDGKVDIVVNDANDVSVVSLLGNGDGTFAVGRSFNVGGNIREIELGDFNNDAISDLIVTDGNSPCLHLLLGRGDGTFATAATITTTYTNLFVKVADLNRDGNLDFVVGKNGSPQYSQEIMLGQGDGTFKSSALISGTFGSSITDINGDGILDIAAVGAGRTAQISIGNGDGTFAAALSFTSGVGVASSVRLTTGDINGDSVADIVTMNFNDNSMSVLLASTRESATIPKLDLLSLQGARNALNTISAQSERISAERAVLGSYASRMEVALSMTASLHENYLQAAARITDVDIALETAELVRRQILQQATSSVLAQANQQPGIALMLLNIQKIT